MQTDASMRSFAQDFVARQHNAARRFIDNCIDQAKLSEADAIDVMTLYIKAKLMKLDGVNGHFYVKNGVLLDVEILQEAARKIRSGEIKL